MLSTQDNLFTRPLRWGILGAGDVAVSKGGPALQQASNSSIRAVMRRDPTQAKTVAQQLGAPDFYTDVQALLDHDEIDAIYVATPVDTHAYYAVAAAQANKHVLVEKPMGMNAKECQQMIAACHKHGVQLGVAYYRRFFPIVKRMQELIESGQLGVIISARAAYVTKHVPPPNDWRLDPARSGGGCLADVGSHRLDLLLALLGPVASVSALTDAKERRVEQTATVMLGFASGAQATCTIIWGSAGFCDQLEVIGTKGRLLASPFDQGQLAVDIGETIQHEQHAPMRPTHLGLVEDFVAAVREKRAPTVSGEVGLATTRVIDAAYEG